MKKTLLVICLVSVLFCAGCAKESTDTTPDIATPVPTDNGVDAFLRGENPGLMEKFKEAE